MNPTPRLRWIEREIRAVRPDGDSFMISSQRILQQWFAYDIQYPMTKGEWRDVPLEKE